ncbi:MAG: flagellar hook capping FlgD N-terminal domain-containing protein [Phycisphaerales bacterium]
MAIDAIGTSRTGSTQASGYSAMTSDDFTKIILSELGKQDPLAPNDTNQLIQQIANIRGIQSDMDLGDRLGKLASHDEFASAAGLMGRTIRGIGEDAGAVEGKVVGVSRSDDGAVLRLDDGTRVRFSKVDEIADAAEPPAEEPSDDDQSGDAETQG